VNNEIKLNGIKLKQYRLLIVLLYM